MGFVEFLFETKKGKKMMGLLYGLGGAVVIVGALFKIMHWPGASLMLIVGLGTEALIFVVSAFEPPHMDLDWTLAYPELAGLDDEGGHGSHGKAKATGGSLTAQLDGVLAEAKLEPEMIQSLGEGLRKLSDNANKLTEISDAAVATNDYTETLKSASDKVSELSDTYKQASETLTGLSAAANEGASTGEQLQKMATTLESLNSSYELQLQSSQNISKMYEGIDSLMTNLSESVEDTKRYKENISELSNNLSSLNRVYGNMLTAMTGNSNS